MKVIIRDKQTGVLRVCQLKAGQASTGIVSRATMDLAVGDLVQAEGQGSFKKIEKPTETPENKNWNAMGVLDRIKNSVSNKA